MGVRVEEARAVDDELVDAFARLVPQLSRSNPAPTEAELAEVARSEASHLLVARDDGGTIVGSLTLVLFRIPTAMRAWIEDVVVDESARGRGVGEALNREALRLAAEAGAKTVDLTSRPSLGFKERDTNVYRIEL